MAITIAELAQAIRASTEAPTGTILADVTRLHAYADAAITRYAGDAVPDAVRDMAMVQLCQWLYDAPVGERSRPAHALAQSGARSMLAPYRSHNLDVEAAEAVADALMPAMPAGVDREAVVAIVTELVSGWALQGNADDIPAGKLENAPATGPTGGLNQGAVDNRIGALVWEWAQAADNATLIPLSKLPDIPLSKLPDIPGSDVTIVTTGFDGNLSTSDNDVQKLAQRLDDLVISGGGNGDGPAGLTQAQVDTRINTLIPVDRRTPDPAGFTSSDDGVFPVWNESDGEWSNGNFHDANGFTWTFDSDTNQWKVDYDVPLSQVYEEVAKILTAGHRVTITPNDGAHRLTVAVADIPSGNNFPASSTVGDRFRLLAEDSLHNDKLVDLVDPPGPFNLNPEYTADIGTGFPELRTYPTQYSQPGLGVLAGKTVLWYPTASPSNLVTKLYFYGTEESRTSYDVNQSPIAGPLPRAYEIPTLTIAKVRQTVDIDSQTDAYTNLEFADGTLAFPDTDFVPGDYTYTGGANHWQLTSGIAAPWATQGQPEPRTELSVATLIDGPGAGLAVTNSGQDARTLLTTFNPGGVVFDLDVASNQQGIVEVECVVTMSGRSANTISFDDGAVVTRLTFSGFVFASHLRQSTAYVPPNVTGIQIGSTRNVYQGSTKLGELVLRIARNAMNQVGYYLYYNGISGSANWNFATNLSVAFLHNDGASAGATTFVALTDTPSSLSGEGGKHVAVNSAGTALELVNAPTGGGASEQVILDTSSPTFSLSNSNALGNIVLNATQKAAVLAALHGGKTVRAMINDGIYSFISEFRGDSNTTYAYGTGGYANHQEAGWEFALNSSNSDLRIRRKSGSSNALPSSFSIRITAI